MTAAGPAPFTTEEEDDQRQAELEAKFRADEEEAWLKAAEKSRVEQGLEPCITSDNLADACEDIHFPRHAADPENAGAMQTWETVQSSPTLPPKTEWSWRSVGATMRGLAQDVGSAAARTAQTLAVEVSRNSVLLATQLSEGVGRTNWERSVPGQFAVAQERARSLGWRVAERVVWAGGELNEAFQFFDSTPNEATESTPSRLSSLTSPWSVVQEEAKPVLRELRFAPLSLTTGAMELLSPASASGSPECNAQDMHSRSCSSSAAHRWQELGALSQECWRRWRQKHAALTASEGLYASLLADSRRTSTLTAELSAVEVLLKEADDAHDVTAATSSSFSACSREKSMSTCRAAVEARATEAVQGFRERIRNYPCGRACTLTKHFRIARSSEEIDAVTRAFEARVAQETEEALSQAMEIVVAPNLQTLAESLARRVEFWEREIEDNWALWTAQSTIFHEACEGVGETWSDLQDIVLQLLAWIREDAEAPSSSTPPIVFLLPFLDMKDVQHHRLWEDLHAVLVEVAAMVTLLGAWTDYHNLRGDGQTSQQAQVLLLAILRCFDMTFDESFRGREAIIATLAADPSWCLVADAAEAAAPEECPPWWSPHHWPAPPDHVHDSWEPASSSGASQASVVVSSEPFCMTQQAPGEGAVASLPLVKDLADSRQAASQEGDAQEAHG